MSFDVYLIAASCPTCGRGGDGEPLYSFNITHNVNAIVDRCLVAGGASRAKTVEPEHGHTAHSWGRLDGWRAGDVIEILNAARAVSRDPTREAEFLALEPTNGWGTLTHVRTCLDALYAACEEHPDTTIRASG